MNQDIKEKIYEALVKASDSMNRERHAEASAHIGRAMGMLEIFINPEVDSHV